MMDDQEELRLKVARQIKEAFANVPRLNSRQVAASNAAFCMIDKQYLGKAWWEIPPDVLWLYSDDWRFMTQRALRFFVPAFMYHMLLNPNRLDSIVDVGLAYLRTPKTITSLTLAEVEAIIAFLEWRLNLYDGVLRHNTRMRDLLETSVLGWMFILDEKKKLAK
jgi:hypothetical protein